MQYERLRKIFSSVGAVLCFMILMSSAQTTLAVGIGGNFRREATAVVAATEMAGLPAVQQANWNNLDAGADNSDRTFNGLVDSDGNSVLTTVDITKNGVWRAGALPTDPSARMLYNHIGNTNVRDGSYSISVNITSIPYTTYDLYVYLGGNSSAPGKGLIRLNGGSNVYWNSIVNPSWDTTTWTPATDTTGAGNPANYVLYSGLSGDVLLEAGSPDVAVGICGFQIVNTAALPPVTGTFSLYYPADNATGLSIEAASGVFYFTGLYQSGFRVYLKKDSAPVPGTDAPLTEVSNTNAAIDFGLLEASTTYYWLVEAYNATNAVVSAPRSFTTAASGQVYPTSFSQDGMVLHLDAAKGTFSDAAGTTAANVGEKVLFWKDQSPAGNDATTTVTGALDPTLTADGVTFNKEFLGVFNSTDFDFGTGAFHVFQVSRPTDIEGADRWPRVVGDMDHEAFSGGRQGWVSGYKKAGGQTNITMDVDTPLFEPAGSTNREGLWTISDTGRSDSAVVQATEGNVLLGTATYAENLTNTHDLAIGASSVQDAINRASGSFIGDIAEVIIFNKAKSEAELKEIRLYLSGKHGIEISRPVAQIVSPAPGDSFLLGQADVTLSVEASDVNGIQTVDFIIDEVLAGTATTEIEGLFSIDWTPPAQGRYSLRVLVTDNDSPAPLIAVDNATIEVVAPTYVTVGGGGDGSSFTNALTLAQAVTAANDTIGAVSPIFMMAGVYPLTAELGLSADVEIYGGFAATEGFPEDRTGTPGVDNVTELNGGGVTRIQKLTSNLLFDRLTFKNGYSLESGGALYISTNYTATVVDSNFEDNVSATPIGTYNGGGAVFVDANPGSPFLRCRFLNNTATEGHGGAVMSRYSGAPSFRECYFEGNSAPAGAGGAIGKHGVRALRIYASTFKANSALRGGGYGVTNPNAERSYILNSVFLNNTASEEGGAIYAPASTRWKLVHCTFHANSTTAGTTDGVWIGIRNGAAESPAVANNLFSGHTKLALNYSYLDDTDPLVAEINSNLFVGGVADGANGWTITQDPSNTSVVLNTLTATGNNYVNVAADNFDLIPGAPALNQGIASSVPVPFFFNVANTPDFGVDLLDRLRFDGSPDLGAYELGEAKMTLTPSSLHFGYGLSVGLATTQTLTIESSGNLAIEIESATITGNPSSAVVFETIGDTAPFSPIPTLEPGESLDVVVQMTPPAENQNFTGQILVQVVGAPSALAADLTGGTINAPTAVRNSWMLYE